MRTVSDKTGECSRAMGSHLKGTVRYGALNWALQRLTGLASSELNGRNPLSLGIRPYCGGDSERCSDMVNCRNSFR